MSLSIQAGFQMSQVYKLLRYALVFCYRSSHTIAKNKYDGQSDKKQSCANFTLNNRITFNCVTVLVLIFSSQRDRPVYQIDYVKVIRKNEIEIIH